MKVIIFIDWFAPAYKAGGPIQSIVNLVSQPIEGVEYRIICSNKDLDGGLLEGIRYNEWVPYNAYTQVWYNAENKNVRRVLKDVGHWKPDIFFVNGIYSFYYNFLPLLFGKAEKKIISARGMLHTGALSQKSGKKKIYLALWRLLGFHRRYFFHATNTNEEQFIKAVFGPKTRVYVAANLPRVLEAGLSRGKKQNALELISIGLISPMKNYKHVLQALRHCKAEINYTIYGPVKDFAYWAECRQIIEGLPSNICVQYKGDLPSVKVPEALAKAQVFILPSKSENFGHAIYEAFTAGLPVITSHNTPWNGLREAQAGINISPENDYELSKAICFFAAANEAELGKWSAGARAYAEKAVDLGRIKLQYASMFQI